MRREFLLASLMLLSIFGVVSAAVLDRSKPDIHGDHPLSKWKLRSVTIDHSIQKNGKPVLKVPMNVVFNGPAFRIKGGKKYSCVIDYKGIVWPSTNIRFGITFLNRFGIKIKNSKTASTWMYRKDEVGKWREAVNVFTTPPGAKKAFLLLSRFEDSSPNTPTQLSSKIYCHEGNFWKGQPDPKRPFNGSLIQVTSDGLFIIDGKPQFLRCMYADNNDPNKIVHWKRMAHQGWNCNMWAPSLKNIKMGVETGLTYAFFSLSPYFHQKSKPRQRGWAYGKLALLEKNLQEIMASPYAQYLVGYYMDDEAPAEYRMIEQVIKIVDRLDRDSTGQRQRPIYALEGNAGRALQHLHHIDILGTYVRGGDTGGESNDAFGHQTLNYADGMDLPRPSKTDRLPLFGPPCPGPKTNNLGHSMCDRAKNWAKNLIKRRFGQPRTFQLSLAKSTEASKILSLV